jgi:hypothetical protein
LVDTELGCVLVEHHAYLRLLLLNTRHYRERAKIGGHRIRMCSSGASCLPKTVAVKHKAL